MAKGDLSDKYCRTTCDSFMGGHSAPDLSQLMFGFCLLCCRHGDGLPKRAYRQPAEGNGGDPWSLDSWLCVWRHHGNLLILTFQSVRCKLGIACVGSVACSWLRLQLMQQKLLFVATATSCKLASITEKEATRIARASATFSPVTSTVYNFGIHVSRACCRSMFQSLTVPSLLDVP